MKRGHIELAILAAILSVAVIGAVFMFNSSSPSALATGQFTEEQTNCLMGCYEDVRAREMSNLPPSREGLALCIKQCEQE